MSTSFVIVPVSREDPPLTCDVGQSVGRFDHVHWDEANPCKRPARWRVGVITEDGAEVWHSCSKGLSILIEEQTKEER